MPMHSIWKPNNSDIVLRVPGGWVYTVMQRPVFVAEPHPIILYRSEPVKEDDSIEDIDKLLDVLEKETCEKKEGVSCKPVQSDEEESIGAGEVGC